jgi:translocation and assembly module TamB
MRRWSISLAALGAAFLAVLALLPWWLGPALVHLGPRYGLTVRRYERIGYRQFRVDGVTFRRGPVEVTIADVTATTPLLWLMQHAGGRPDPVRAGRWTTRVLPTGAVAPAATPGGWVPLRAKLRTIADRLATWVPVADVGPGDVEWPKGKLTFAGARWANRELTTSDLGYRALHVAARARFPAADEIQVDAEDRTQALHATLVSRAGEIGGTVSWAEQPVQVEARFAATGWRPTAAHVHGENWNVAAERAKLGAHYATLSGRLAVDWQQGALTADVDLKAQPRPHDPAPPLAVVVHAAGRDDGIVVNVLDVRLPGIAAHLTDAVNLDRSLRLQSQPARFVVEAQLGEQPWFPAGGRLRGEGRIAPATDGLAAIDFDVTGDQLTVARLQIAHVAASGRLLWPRLELRSVAVRWPDQRTIDLAGTWDFLRRELIGGRVRGGFARASVAPWLPPAFEFDAVEFSATAEGPGTQLRHRGEVRLSAWRRAPLPPMDVTARWTGAGAAANELTAEAALPRAHVSLRGSADATSLRVDALTLGPKDGEVLRSAQPFAVRWRPELELDPVKLAGASMQIGVGGRWGPAGQANLTARNVTADWLREFVALPKPAWTLQHLQVQATWDRSPLRFTGSAAMAIALGGGRAAEAQVQLRGTDEGIEIQSLQASEAAGVIVTASGRLPLLIRPAQEPLVVLRSDGPFALDAATTTNPGFWEKLTELTGVEIADPVVQVHLQGTFARPEGEATLRAARIAASPGRFKWEWPRIEHVNLRLAGDRDGIRLDALKLEIDGQPLRVEGRVPVEASRWFALLRDPRQLAEHGELRVEVPEADLSAIARYVPAYLAPSGRLQLDLTLRSDQTVQGFIRIRDAASRPLGPLGVLQDVQADVRFEGRSVRLAEVTARMGGQRVSLQGRADLPAYETPRFDFTLRGDNLPFVRRTGLLVRGDLDLTLKTQADGRNEIGGQVRLRDSLFVADLRALLPSGSKGAASRPPYFAIEMAPLNTWRLAVQVQGERFMRLRTPVFNGTASARIRLDGVLANPRATGQVVIDEGTIRLPFASFEVRQGEVRLAPEQAEPQLMVNGTTRRYGYDLRLELTGAASAPNLTFTSSPPLEAEQVLLMVMAGQAPHNEIATTDRQRAARFGAFFGQSLLGTLGGDAGGADRLTISSGENISAQGRETYNIEYRLNDRWALTGEYDEFDEYYGGVKWRIYQKGGKKSRASQ